MMDHPGVLPTSRELLTNELLLVGWMLEHGTAEAKGFKRELSALKVMSACSCGCPSINFTKDWVSGMQILSDYEFDDEKGGLAGVFLFSYDNKLAGLEFWSIDGIAEPAKIPHPSQLRCFVGRGSHRECN